ncbi:MAG TPA: restriction endonuclease [Gammaproteobacteria bacterium]|nr:restriction endonuclease [Gammaproteobacteria bacterium]
MQGKLFSQNFLSDGITETAAWKNLDTTELEQFRLGAAKAFRKIPASARPNEAATEDEIIRPILELLGWSDNLRQQAASGKGRSDVPDFLLFANSEAKNAALSETDDSARYRHGLAILEAKRWRRPLDRGDATDLLDPGTPSNQILRYLSRVDVASNRAIRWGMLTNGRHWRLYFQDARARSEEFLEFDLASLLAVHDVQADLFSPESAQPDHYLRVFYLLFRRVAFLPQPEDPLGRSFHLLALDESRYWEARVSQSLGESVFERIFPDLVQALVKYDPAAPTAFDKAYLETVRQDALIFLYRLLFLFFAEDRNLLPAHDNRYDDYSLRKIRTEIANREDAGDVFSTAAEHYSNHLKDLFRAVSRGDESIGVPPYNGGLFDAGQHPLLARVQLPDAVLAGIIDTLSRDGSAGARKWINYRDLSVQQLGSIYERLLEHTVVPDGAGGVTTRLSIFGRKGSGSYYTHDDLVKLIIEQAVGPLVQERIDAFANCCSKLAHSNKPKSSRLQALKSAGLDPAAALLDLKICDPAMGSGHFLVALVDYLADRTLELMADVPALVDWAPNDRPYASPLTRRIVDIRERILASSEKHGWRVDVDQLDDRHIVRRMILKRVIHGVDKNPMAVELAKVSLWLHTFTVGAPLSFLDHHVRTGDALYGERVERVLDELRHFGALFHQHVLTRIGVATESMAKLSELTDVDIAEVHQSKKLFDDIASELRPLNRLLDFWHGLRWLAPLVGKKSLQSEEHRGLAELLDGRFGELMDVVASGSVAASRREDTAAAEAAHTLLERTRELAGREHFMHWEVAFPIVWRGLAEGRPQGGFDAIIGNPPWDRMKLQEVEWFAARRPEIALSARASDRKKKIIALRDEDDPLWRDYQEAKRRAETAARVARAGGEYPQLSGGDINIYSLFVERSETLAKETGIVGLLTPSGIASDLGASKFFKSVATHSRLKALFDFENKKVFFPDVHASFKFCALVFSGIDRRFDEAQCAFFLHAVAELTDSDKRFTLTAADFAAVNPNTGTAPIFRRCRDAEVTTAIYARLPVLVDRRSAKRKAVWPVKYATMFHMTNDSALFKHRDELEAEGYYPVPGSRWKKGDDEFLPLYEGKMVQMYDHRAASIKINPENLNRPAQPVPASAAEHANPQWLPDAQFWVAAKSLPTQDQWVIGFKDVTAPTNIRTMIAAALPAAGYGNTLPIFAAQDDGAAKEFNVCAPLLLANMNSLVFDYLARQKVQGQHLNLYIVEQIPVLTATDFAVALGECTASDFVRDQVLHLTYTADDMAPFARDMGYQSGPFIWDDEDRRHRMARLDALFFHLYGINRGDTAYILDQFPIVREQDEKTFGRYRTKDLVLAYMNAIAAGDLTTQVDA